MLKTRPRGVFARVLPWAGLVLALAGCWESAGEEPTPTEERDLGQVELGLGGAGAVCAQDSDCGDAQCWSCNGSGACIAKNTNTNCGNSAADVCDLQDKCDGAGTCVDLKASASQNCGNGSGNSGCDLQDKCDGAGACVDLKAPNTQDCGSGPSGSCDLQNKCDGSGNCADLVQPNTHVCDTDPGGCNPDDTCDGFNKSCPEKYAVVGTSCGNGPADLCDAQDTCDGSGACVDRKVAASTLCRSAAAVCDADDFCDGSSKVCTDGKKSTSTVCRTHIDVCDADDKCDGSNNTCPVLDNKQPNSFVCRNKADVCDVAEKCDGSSDACPIDLFDSGTSCRPAVAGGCDIAEFCNGSGASCPVDLFEPITTKCNNSGGVCEDDRYCPGDAAACPHAYKSAQTSCRTAVNVCDTTEFCTGAAATCPVNSFASAQTTCDDGVGCTTSDHCKGDDSVCLHGTADDTLCPAGGDPAQKACATWFCDQVTDCQFTPLPSDTVCHPELGICDVEETCDGTNPTCPTDDVKPSTTICQTASCVNGVAKAQTKCDGSTVTCDSPPDANCDPYTCNDAGTKCRSSCSDSVTDCVADHYCDNGVCKPRVNPGSPCSDASQCSSSNPYCVDGVCCDAKCDSQCEACDVKDTEGTCSIVTGTPRGGRKACSGSGVCKGTCDGTTRTTCTYPDEALECAPADCDALTNLATDASFCDGAGACKSPKSVDCAPYACGTTECRGNCTADSDCDNSAYCRSGVCQPKEDDGSTCARASECSSGFCADSVCCNARCDGQCEACNQPGDAGTCVAVTGDPVGKRPVCAGSDDCAGSCDGQQRASCSYPGAEIECRPASCDAAVATLAAHCDGSGTCASAVTVDCPEDCEGVVCAGDACVIDADCAADEYCAAGVCMPRQPDGNPCSADGDCSSDFCVDGVCCESACLGQCEACDVAGSEGTCSAVTAGEGPHGGRAQCTSDGSVCAGSCDGSTRDGCDYPTGDVCRDGSCKAGGSGSTAVVEAKCQGDGRCPSEQRQSCGGDACTKDGSECDGACASDPSACGPTEYCSAGVCVSKRPDGSDCASESQCQSGFCVDGVCCETACTGGCEACDVADKLGVCTAVSGLPHGGRESCQGSGTCGAACDGTSRDECTFPDVSTSCAPAFCSNGSESSGQSCDGAGRCAPGEVVACLSYSCDGASCDTTCSTDADCTGENRCVDGACEPSPLIDARDEGSCGCRVPGARGGSDAWVVILALSLAGSVFRRRRRAELVH